MSPCLSLVLLLMFMVVTVAMAGKYVYVQSWLTWPNAQKYCRTHHTDLAPVNTSYDMSLIQKLQFSRIYTWIGLERTNRSSTGWMWSGGEEMHLKKDFWAPSEPNNVYGKEDYVVIVQHRLDDFFWQDVSNHWVIGFLCYKVHAIRKRMTWYNALQYCRKNHQDLASVASGTEMMLIKQELSKDLSSHNVWIGLQFLSGNWMWTDGQPFTYESWGTDPKSTCPVFDWSCGAIRVEGTYQNPLHKVEGVAGWNVLDCNQELHFLCY